MLKQMTKLRAQKTKMIKMCNFQFSCAFQKKRGYKNVFFQLFKNFLKKKTNKNTREIL